jgi:hypothetical protein
VHVTLGFETELGELSVEGTDLLFIVSALDDGLSDGSDPVDCLIDRNKILCINSHQLEKLGHCTQDLLVLKVAQEVVDKLLCHLEIKLLLVPLAHQESQHEIHVAERVFLWVQLLHYLNIEVNLS